MDELDLLFFKIEKLNISSDHEDCDEYCDEDIINGHEPALPSTQFYVEEEIDLSLQHTNVLHLCSSLGVTDRLFLGLSNLTSVVYDLETLTQVSCLTGHQNTITGMKIYSGDDRIVFTSSLDGTIKLWDLRRHEIMVKEYKDNSEGNDNLKPLTSFDISSNKMIIAAGTELFKGDAFVVFWDARSTKRVAGCKEIHNDDITQMKFHPTDDHWLATGSKDGTWNMIDISENINQLSDGLYNSNLTDHSIHKLQWFMQSDDTDGLSCITHTHNLQVWKTRFTAEQYAEYKQEDISDIMQGTDADKCYLVDFLPGNVDEVLVVAGKTDGSEECLEMLKLQKRKLFPVAVFNGNRQIVHSCCITKQRNVFVTGGESGVVTIWKTV